jgi:3,4-dihydroxy 2-butanone 4-phosphate synthase/GTP cyclohydrolase II
LAPETQHAGAARVQRLARTFMPTAYGAFEAVGYRDTTLGCDHVALVAGDLEDAGDVLVRMHSECLTGEAFGSLRCDCGEQLTAALRAMTEEGRGVLVYLRGHEGRSIGLGAKLAAYELQDEGYDTVDANVALGFPPDAREYGAGAAVLADLGVRGVRLLTNNPEKAAGLRAHGVVVRSVVPLIVPPGRENLRYLGTKRDRMGHDLPGDSDVDLSPELEGTAL